ncbi:hypothetical protein TGP89_257568 [Toxoplasma gondii p89]|uniref:Uncharacterized protein n=1 Tax=Toxoplasma gondii p89 TaxID=943119 RepID=A0A086L131_TOXGO|nr:hypothetical protein TGP89_257568 [Toxoplasma gondii p89]
MLSVGASAWTLSLQSHARSVETSSATSDESYVHVRQPVMFSGGISTRSCCGPMRNTRLEFSFDFEHLLYSARSFPVPCFRYHSNFCQLPDCATTAATAFLRREHPGGFKRYRCLSTQQLCEHCFLLWFPLLNVIWPRGSQRCVLRHFVSPNLCKKNLIRAGVKPFIRHFLHKSFPCLADRSGSEGSVRFCPAKQPARAVSLCENHLLKSRACSPLLLCIALHRDPFAFHWGVRASSSSTFFSAWHCSAGLHYAFFCAPRTRVPRKSRIDEELPPACTRDPFWVYRVWKFMRGRSSVSPVGDGLRCAPIVDLSCLSVFRAGAFSDFFASPQFGPFFLGLRIANGPCLTRGLKLRDLDREGDTIPSVSNAAPSHREVECGIWGPRGVTQFFALLICSTGAQSALQVATSAPFFSRETSASRKSGASGGTADRAAPPKTAPPPPGRRNSTREGHGMTNSCS